ncbi:transglycosylase family protein [Streptomyces sp. NPDC048639]|uniref:transglycosylase family protein n=1 Tax=Streptomyces sp. NPDC048639 TaxID=3365581 RepID=UPI00371BD099
MSHVLIGRSMVLAFAALMAMAPGASEAAAPAAPSTDKSPGGAGRNGKNGTGGKFGTGGTLGRSAGGTKSVMGVLAVSSGKSGTARRSRGAALATRDGTARRSVRSAKDNDGNTGSTGSTAVWDRLAQCESSGRWHINSGNGYFGGLQIHHRTWVEHGGLVFAARADLATKQEQITVARSVQARQGWNAWPVCAKRAGATSPVRPATQVDAARAVSRRIHVVRAGETLSSIARRYRVPGGWQALHKANARVIGSDPDRLVPGTKLRVPVARPAKRPAVRPAAVSRPAPKPAARPAAAAAPVPVPVVKRPEPDRTPSPAAARGAGGVVPAVSPAARPAGPGARKPATPPGSPRARR